MTPIEDIGTDPNRFDSFDAGFVPYVNTLGAGYDWQFTHFQKTTGYANSPLDGIWLRAPYLHNGSVPTLWHLLNPQDRPAVFYRGDDTYDFRNVGLQSHAWFSRRGSGGEGTELRSGERSSSTPTIQLSVTASRPQSIDCHNAGAQ